MKIVARKWESAKERNTPLEGSEAASKRPNDGPTFLSMKTGSTTGARTRILRTLLPPISPNGDSRQHPGKGSELPAAC